EDQALARGVGANALVARTPDLGEAVAALERGLATRPAPAPSTDVVQLREEHIARQTRQLERQAASAAELARRCVLQGAALSVVRRLSEVLGRNERLDAALEDVLYIVIDMSSGLATALYLRDEAGGLRLG